MNNQQKHAGKSTRDMAQKRYRNRVWFVIIAIGIALLILLVANNSQALGIGSLGFLGLIILSQVIINIADARTKKMIKEERRAIRGAKGEEKIGAILETLGENYTVLHDIESPYGNIDHIVISKQAGLSLIETKAHGGRVSVNNGHLLVNGQKPEKDFIVQALSNAYWLRETIANVLGIEVWITPILAFTNAFVERTAPVKGVSIINKKFLLNTLQRSNGKAENLVIWNNREKIISTIYDRQISIQTSPK
jgi:hypothetical protein